MVRIDWIELGVNAHEKKFRRVTDIAGKMSGNILKWLERMLNEETMTRESIR